MFSALATGYLKNEVDDVKDTVEDQAALGVKLASDADLLGKKVSSNCQKVNNRASQQFQSYLPHSGLNQNSQEHFW